MRFALVGDGLLAHLILHEWGKRAFRDQIVWFRGLTPATPPVSLLHRHVGRSFETDSARETAWATTVKFIEELLPEVQFARQVKMLRPASIESRLEKSFRTHPLPHIHRESFADYPFLAPSDVLFSYNDAYTVDCRRLYTFVATELPKLNIVRTSALTAINECRDRSEWELTNLKGETFDCSHVIFVTGPRTPQWFDGLELEVHPGELILFDRMDAFPVDVAMSRNGHVVPSVCGEYICAGATFLHPVADIFPVVDRRSVDTSIAECMTGIERSVPMLKVRKNAKVWYGKRAVTNPERLPIVGPTDRKNVFIATALGSKGMLWGPVVAQSLINLIEGDLDVIPIKSIRSTRYPIALRSGRL